MAKVILNAYIVADPAICHGKPTFQGTRIMVWQILAMLAAGETTEAIVKAFPGLKLEHINAALDYASSLTRDHYVVINTGDEVPA